MRWKLVLISAEIITHRLFAPSLYRIIPPSLHEALEVIIDIVEAPSSGQVDEDTGGCFALTITTDRTVADVATRRATPFLPQQNT